MSKRVIPRVDPRISDDTQLSDRNADVIIVAAYPVDLPPYTDRLSRA